MSFKNIQLVLFGLMIMKITVFTCQLVYNDQNLKKQLLANYSKTSRPGDYVSVYISLILFHLIGIDEKNQIMTSFLIINQTWFDSRLAWDPRTYNNSVSISLPLDNIWKPTTAVANSAYGDGNLTTNKENSYVDILYTGTVYLTSQAISLQTRCTLDVSKCPFNSQICNITFASWPFLTSQNTIYYFTNQTSPISTLGSNHSIWNLLSITYTIDYGYSGLGYKVILKFERKSTYYMMNSIVPCLILNVIILIAFFLPFANQMALILY
jgi:nicotinic acetylcholine receptor, invertebrate